MIAMYLDPGHPHSLFFSPVIPFLQFLVLDVMISCNATETGQFILDRQMYLVIT